jgi:hypothetical protein
MGADAGTREGFTVKLEPQVEVTPAGEVKALRVGHIRALREWASMLEGA